jgi:hypothetical protein
MLTDTPPATNLSTVTSEPTDDPLLLHLLILLRRTAADLFSSKIEDP